MRIDDMTHRRQVATSTHRTEEERVVAAPEHVRRIYSRLRDAATSWPEVQVGVTGDYIKFHCRNNFVEVHLQRRCVKLVLRREISTIPCGATRTLLGLEVEHVPASHGRTSLEHRVAVRHDDQVPAAIQLMRRSYDVVIPLQEGRGREF